MPGSRSTPAAHNGWRRVDGKGNVWVRDEPQQGNTHSRWRRVDGKGNVWVREDEPPVEPAAHNGWRRVDGEGNVWVRDEPQRDTRSVWRQIDGQGQVWVRDDATPTVGDPGSVQELERIIEAARASTRDLERIIASSTDAVGAAKNDPMLRPVPTDDLEERIIEAARAAMDAAKKEAGFMSPERHASTEDLEERIIAAARESARAIRWKRVEGEDNSWVHDSQPALGGSASSDDLELEKRIIAAAQAAVGATKSAGLATPKGAGASISTEDLELERLLRSATPGRGPIGQGLEESIISAARNAIGSQRWHKGRHGRFGSKTNTAGEPSSAEDFELEERIIHAARAAVFAQTLRTTYHSRASSTRASPPPGDQAVQTPSRSAGEVGASTDDLEERIISAARKAIGDYASNDAGLMSPSHQSAATRWRQVDGDGNVWVRAQKPSRGQQASKSSLDHILAAARASTKDLETILASSREAVGAAKSSFTASADDLELEERIIAAARAAVGAAKSSPGFMSPGGRASTTDDLELEKRILDAARESVRATRWRRVDDDGSTWVREDAPDSEGSAGTPKGLDLEERILSSARNAIGAQRWHDSRPRYSRRPRSAEPQGSPTPEGLELEERILASARNSIGAQRWHDGRPRYARRPRSSEPSASKKKGMDHIINSARASTQNLERVIASSRNAIGAARNDFSVSADDLELEERIIAAARAAVGAAKSSPGFMSPGGRASTTDDLELEKRILDAARESVRATRWRRVDDDGNMWVREDGAVESQSPNTSKKLERIIAAARESTKDLETILASSRDAVSAAKIDFSVSADDLELEERIIAAARAAVKGSPGFMSPGGRSSAADDLDLEERILSSARNAIGAQRWHDSRPRYSRRPRSAEPQGSPTPEGLELEERILASARNSIGAQRWHDGRPRYARRPRSSEPSASKNKSADPASKKGLDHIIAAARASTQDLDRVIASSREAVGAARSSFTASADDLELEERIIAAARAAVGAAKSSPGFMSPGGRSSAADDLDLEERIIAAARESARAMRWRRVDDDGNTWVREG